VKALGVLLVSITASVHLFDLWAYEFFKELFLFHFLHPNSNGSGKGNPHIAMTSENIATQKVPDLIFVLVLHHELLLKSLDELREHFEDTLLEFGIFHVFIHESEDLGKVIFAVLAGEFADVLKDNAISLVRVPGPHFDKFL
jgi:hypothetical protein